MGVWAEQHGRQERLGLRRPPRRGQGRDPSRALREAVLQAQRPGGWERPSNPGASAASQQPRATQLPPHGDAARRGYEPQSLL